MATKANRTKRKTVSVGKTLRNQAIIAESATGATQTEIGERYGLTRQAVSEILSSEEAQKMAKLGETRLRLMMTKALDTFDYLMDNKAEFGLSGAAFRTAQTILKSIGVVKETVEVNHNQTKPFVIRHLDGRQTVMGSKGEDE